MINFDDFKYDEDQVAHLRYRCEGSYHGIKKSDIEKSKLKKINQELLQSKKMEAYFKSHPEERKMVLKAISDNSIKSYKPSTSYLPSYLVHDDTKKNMFADAINKEYGEQKSFRNRRNKGKMEQYLEGLDKGDGTEAQIKF